MNLSRSIILMPFLLIGLLAYAQTMFIPDTYLRGWLNSAKPNSVDVDGYCDTTAWNAVPPDWVYFYFSSVPNNSTIDLEGIQYLKMAHLRITDGSQSNISVVWPGHPRALGWLELTRIDVGLFSGPFLPLPDELNLLDCDDCGLTAVPPFNGDALHMENMDLSSQTLTIPPSVFLLYLPNCNLTQIPVCPNVLSLTISNNPLADWTNLPIGLGTLVAINVGLDQLPPLPPNLTLLTYHDNGLTSLPPLPASLSVLWAYRNELTSLPALPDGMYQLGINGNPITELPSLPSSLQVLAADSCLITALGPLPASLTSLSLISNPITQLPALPGSLNTLKLKHCSSLDCLPLLPGSMLNLQLFNSGVECLPNIPPGLNITGGQDNLGIAAVFCDPGNSACPIVDSLITGTVFNDPNANGVLDVGEVVRPFAVIEAQPGNFLAGSNWNGEYVLPADTGSFTVTGQPTLYEGTTTAPYAVTFTSIGEVDSLNDIGYEVVPGIFDLVTDMEVTATRPGFETTVWVTVRNAGTELTNSTVELIFDDDLVYVASSYTPEAVNGNTVSWTTGTLYPGAHWTAAVTLYAPPGVLIGTVLTHQGSSTPDQLDQTPADNVFVLNDTAVGSYDPNDKRVEPEMLTPMEVALEEPVEWTVRFQNTGTFPAERVLITDTLSSDLRWNTMRPISASHDFTWYILNGVLHVFFNGINLPDSASDEAGSHGFIKFIMKPLSNLQDGAQVANTANIYFDFNEPVITNEAVFTVDASTMVTPSAVEADGWTIWPNPAEDALFITGLVTDRFASVEVMDITGAVVRVERGVGNNTRLDVRDLANGLYALRITSGSTVATRTFIKR